MFRQILLLNHGKGFILAFSNGRDAISFIFSMHQVETRCRRRQKTEQDKVFSSEKARIWGKASLLAIWYAISGLIISDLLSHVVCPFCWVLSPPFFVGSTTAPAISANYPPRSHYVAKESSPINTPPPSPSHTGCGDSHGMHSGKTFSGS